MIDMLNINNDSAKSLRMESKSTQSLTILSTFECKTSGFPGVLLKGLHYTRVFMSRMNSPISWVEVGLGVLSLKENKELNSQGECPHEFRSLLPARTKAEESVIMHALKSTEERR